MKTAKYFILITISTFLFSNCTEIVSNKEEIIDLSNIPDKLVLESDGQCSTSYTLPSVYSYDNIKYKSNQPWCSVVDGVIIRVETNDTEETRIAVISILLNGEPVKMITIEQKDERLSPEVIVLQVSNMTENSIVFNGKVVFTGIPEYNERGFVYGTSNLPTMANTKAISYTSKSESNYSVTVNGLTMGTSYYVRAYAINKYGTFYSDDEISFTMSTQRALVATRPVTDITANSAVFNGNIISRGIPAYTEKGFCYSSSFQNPTITDSKIAVTGTGIGEFTANISGLIVGTTYYVRAYATNSEGTAYGTSISFIPSNPNYVVLSTIGIMVQKTDINTSALGWNSSKNLVENSTVGGYTDWRLPTRNELAVLYNERNTIGGFQTTGSYSYDCFYWSSESYNSSNWWGIDFSDGAADWGGYVPPYYGKARAVRTLP